MKFESPSPATINGLTMKDLTGMKFGLWTVNSLVAVSPRQMWDCTCECGTTRVVSGNSLKAGTSQGCGCRRKERMRQLGHTNRRYALEVQKELKTWRAMISRCTNGSGMTKRNYRERGIHVCEQWRQSFEAFLDDMGMAPGPEYSLDRIDNDLGYFPENCRWATREQQARNKRNTRLIEFDGKKLSVSEWAEVLNIPRRALSLRLDRYGWPVDVAFSTPITKSKVVEFNGRAMTISEWSEETGISARAIDHRLSRGWDVSEALTKRTQQRMTKK